MRGQIKVKLGGKDRGLQFGFGAIRRYCKAMGTDMDGVDLVFNKGPRRLEALSNLVFASMCNYCDAKEEDIDFNMSQMELWLDNAPQDVAGKIIDAFMETTEAGGATGEASKKKSVSRNSIKKPTKQG